MPSPSITCPLCFRLLLALVLAGGGYTYAGQAFAIQVLDEGTQRGIPMAVLETDNHIQLISDSAGWIVFDEPGLMSRPVHFSVSSAGYALPKDDEGRSGIIITAMPGLATEIKLVRTMIAERLYRITGQGVYRDSTLLGKEPPLPFPNINGDVLGQGLAQISFYQGKIVWFWSDTQFATPQTARAVTGAAVDLPGAGGLDPTQGVHLRYFSNDQEETQPLLPAPKGRRATIEGLFSVKDGGGAEHLLAHYAFVDEAGKGAEQGLAEFNDRHTFERKIVLGEEYTWQFPSGHAVEVKTDDGDFIYFASPFCNTRTRAGYDSAQSPTSYEALAWSEDAHKLTWQEERSPITQAEEAKLVSEGKLNEAHARCQLINSATGKALSLSESSVQWNPFRKRWILLGRAKDSSEVWYAEAEDVAGPWHSAVAVTAASPLPFTGISQIAALQQEDGRYIYFAGTLGAPNGAGEETLPRYQDNQMMYRLDVTDARLTAAHGR